ncbi:MAG: 30S ribosomal protein S8 [Clostridium sp.]|nr:MAG: 30S ribosomal protein S8 [Clostridium sp.]
MTDPIADMLTRIRNASKMHHETVELPTSSLKTAILEVLKNEGFIVDYTVSADLKSVTKIVLKYTANNEAVIKGLKRVSKPGLRVYANAEKLPKVLNGLGIAVISTSQGVMTDKAARKLNIGGEVLAYIW